MFVIFDTENVRFFKIISIEVKEKFKELYNIIPKDI